MIVVIAAGRSFGRRRAAELAAPEDEGVFEQAAILQVLDEGGDRLIHRASVVAMVGDGAVIVPRLAGAGKDLHRAHAALDEPTCDQTGVVELPAAIEIARRRRFAVEVENFLGLELHAEGHLHRLDAGFERVVVAAALLQMHLVEAAHQIDLFALGRLAEVAVGEILQHPAWVMFELLMWAPWKIAGEEAVRPQGRPNDGEAGAHGDEAGEVLVLAAQAIEEP